MQNDVRAAKPARVTVTLTEAEVEQAWTRARAQLDRQRRPDVFEHRGDKLRAVANEQGAKIAVAKFYGGRTPRRVRVRHKSWGDQLIMRPALCDRNAHLLVVGTLSEARMVVVGWRWGFECIDPERFDKTLRYPAYRWPEETLRDVFTLLQALEGEQLSLDREAE